MPVIRIHQGYVVLSYEFSRKYRAEVGRVGEHRRMKVSISDTSIDVVKLS